MKIEVPQDLKMKGIYTFTRANLVTKQHFALDAIIKARKDAGQEYMSLVRKLNAMCEIEKFVFINIVPTVGRTMIANNLTSNSPTNVMKITHCALGTSGTTPTNADTTLGAETYRNAIASISNASNIAFATGFFTTTEVTGTFAEAGIFSDGTLTTDSGILLSHVLAAITKTNTQTLTLDWALTIS